MNFSKKIFFIISLIVFGLLLSPAKSVFAIDHCACFYENSGGGGRCGEGDISVNIGDSLNLDSALSAVVDAKAGEEGCSIDDAEANGFTRAANSIQVTEEWCNSNNSSRFYTRRNAEDYGFDLTCGVSPGAATAEEQKADEELINSICQGAHPDEEYAMFSYATEHDVNNNLDANKNFVNGTNFCTKIAGKPSTLTWSRVVSGITGNDSLKNTLANVDLGTFGAEAILQYKPSTPVPSSCVSSAQESFSQKVGDNFYSDLGAFLIPLKKEDSYKAGCGIEGGGGTNFDATGRVRVHIEDVNPEFYLYFNGFFSDAYNAAKSKSSGTSGGTVDKPKPKPVDAAAIEAFYASRYDAPADGILPECAYKGTCKDATDLLLVAVKIGEFLFKIIGSVAFLFFVYGGFTMITAFGNPERFKKGRSILVAAAVGLAISLSAFFLVGQLLDILQVQPDFRGGL